ncbi:MAG: VPDSG-CTERM sorting domain-containing protein [Spartobacteria bacterium]
MKLPKLFLTVLTSALITSAFTCERAQAAMIDGAITFAGGVQFDTMNLATATRVDAFSNVAVVSADGDYAGFVSPNDSVAMATPWIFSPSTPTPGLWSVGGFTFDLDTSTIILQTSKFLLIQGTGSVMGNGFDATNGTFSFSTQSPGAGRGVFSFSASSDSQVPDHGATVALLGIGLIGLEVFRRKLALGSVAGPRVK